MTMVSSGALPNLVVIGAMKCGTTALHRYLDAHPDASMTARKEVNFFVGAEAARSEDPTSGPGQWHRGWDWYASLFDPGAPVRGESSPGYTSPDHPLVAERIAGRLPGVRLIYLVRDPLRRAISQYQHHRGEGGEDRPMAEAILDPHSQYLSRGRYHERLEPFLQHFPAEQILVVVQERLLSDRRNELRRVYEHAGLNPAWWDDRLQQQWHVGADVDGEEPDPVLRDAVAARVGDDTAKLRAFLDDDLREWLT